jgi:hypothetical protein
MARVKPVKVPHSCELSKEVLRIEGSGVHKFARGDEGWRREVRIFIVSVTLYELDLPDRIKAHAAINLEYLKEFHKSPE